MSKTIVFIHGAWMTPLCWEHFQGFFEAKGYTCLAPAWPYKDKPVEEQHRSPDPRLAHLDIAQIVNHYETTIRALPEPPVLIGHSFGGLFTQMLLDRGAGKAGIAIDSAPPKGVLPFYPSVIKANSHVLLTPGGWNRIIQPSFKNFRYSFVHTLPESEQHAVYDRYVVPETGRIFFQAAYAPLNNATAVNFKNNSRGPLLLIAGVDDLICPAAQIRSNYQKYKDSSALTAYEEFDGRVHWIIGQDGWQEVAAYIADWIAKHNL